VARTNNNLNQQQTSLQIHRDQQRTPPNAISKLTFNKTKHETITSTLDIAPTQEPTNTQTNNAFLTLIDNMEFSRSYFDQTGRFPITSSRGNKYVFIFYDYDANAILTTAIPNRQGSTISEAWNKTYKQLQ